MIYRTLLVAACLVASTPAFAQVNTLEADNPRENARLRLGPVYLTPRIGLSEIGWDTNVYNDEEKESRKKDFTFTLTPQLTAWLPVARRGLVKATASSDAVYFREESSERSVDSNVTARGEVYLRRITVFAGGGVVYARMRPNLEIDLRSRRVARNAGAGLDVRFTPKTSLELSFARSSLGYDEDAVFLGTRLKDTLDQTSNRVGIVGRYRYSPMTTMALRAERFETRFASSPARDSDNVRVMAGAELKPRALINGEAFVGIRHLNPIDELVLPEFSGLVSDVSLQYSLAGATTFEVSHVRDIEASFEVRHPYYVNNGVDVGIRRALGPHFDVEVTAGRHRYAYRNLLTAPAAGVAPPEPRVDLTVSYGGSVGYRVGRQGRIGVGALYSRRESPEPLRSYDGVRIRTTVTYGF